MACGYISIGEGNVASFWQILAKSAWLEIVRHDPEAMFQSESLW